MNPSPSPPQEAEHIRHQQLTPESPRPQIVPSPANIPILELQMDPNYNESLQNNGTTTPASQFASQAQTSHAFPSTLQFADPSSAHILQGVGVQSADGNGPAGYTQSAAYGGSTGPQAQDTSLIQNFSAQHQSRAASTSDAAQTPGQDFHSAYPFAHDHAYAAQHAQAQSAPGIYYQTEGNAGTSVDVQALLDSLNPSANSAPTGQTVASPLSSQTAHFQANASASSHPVANLPPRPPAQDKPATHPNYNPSDDIRSFHPHSLQTPNTQQRTGNGQLQPLSVGRQEYAPLSQGAVQSPTTPAGNGQHQPPRGSGTPDDEDARWPPEVNKRYEDFLDQERKFVTEGQWDQFPMGSRLFIGKPMRYLGELHSDTTRQPPHREGHQARHLPPFLPTWQACADFHKAGIWLRAVPRFRVVSTRIGR
jgi:hypothetical protein